MYYNDKDDGKGIDKDKIENVFNRFESGKSYDSMHAGIRSELIKAYYRGTSRKCQC